MWSHYANSHKGFCLEWDAAKINAEPVTYQSKIATFDILDVVKMQFGLLSHDEVGQRIWKSLKVKLDEWEYEGEHRVQFGNGMKHLVQKETDKFSIVSYEPEWIKSVIFGCRMDERAIEYLDSNLPNHIERKYSKERSSTIEIVPTY